MMSAQKVETNPRFQGAADVGRKRKTDPVVALWKKVREARKAFELAARKADEVYMSLPELPRPHVRLGIEKHSAARQLLGSPLHLLS